jgi:signal transduction histidine kinase
MSVVPLEHRAGRVIAASRVFLALFFLIAVLVDPFSAAGHAHFLLPLLLGYILFSAAFAAVGWKSWWLEYRLALPGLLVDLVVFAALILLTGGFASPFRGFSIFPIIGSAMRWQLRPAALAAVAILLVFVLAAAIGTPDAESLDPRQLVSRGGSMVVLAAIVLWFWFNRVAPLSAGGGSSSLLDAIVSAEPPARDCLLYAAERLQAARAFLVWSEADEPWFNLLRVESGVVERDKLSSDDLSDPLDSLPASRAFLFDCDARRILVHRTREASMIRGVDPLPPDFADRYAIRSGLAVPIRTSRFDVLLVADSIPGLCSDFLEIAALVGDHVASAFERAALLGSMQDASRAAGRLSLARNLHDGAAQFLAGMALKIRSMKADVGDPEAVRRGLDDLEGELAREQQDVREIIRNLRQPSGRLVRIHFSRHLESMARRLEARWGIVVAPSEQGRARGDDEIMITTGYVYQLDQMIGEAASNAVRHGAARHLSLGLWRDEEELRLEIEDDGSGFPFAGLRDDAELWQRRLGPLSLHQRVRSLGGTLAIASSRTGSTLSLRLPLEEPPR